MRLAQASKQAREIYKATCVQQLWQREVLRIPEGPREASCSFILQVPALNKALKHTVPLLKGP